MTRLNGDANARANVLFSGDTDEQAKHQDLIQNPSFSGSMVVTDTDDEGVFTSTARSSSSYSVSTESTASRLVIDASHSCSQSTTSTGENTSGNLVASVTVQVFFSITRPATAKATVNVTASSSLGAAGSTDAIAEFLDSDLFFDNPGTACNNCTFANEVTIDLPPGDYATEFELSASCGNEAIRPIPQSITASLALKIDIEEDPAPACDLAWGNTAGGAFTAKANWEPKQAPVDDLAGCSNLTFALPQAYTVDYDAAAANNLRVEKGGVTLAGNTLALGGKPAPGGAIKSGLEVESPGQLTLPQGTVTTRETAVGLRALGSGAAPATLTLVEPAALKTDSVLLGNDAGASGLLALVPREDISETPVLDVASFLTIGGLGTGSVQVKDGVIRAGTALVTTLGVGAGSTGTLGLDTSFADLGTQAVVGSEGTGELFLSHGASVNARDMILGEKAGGAGLVQGQFDAGVDIVPASLAVSGDLIVGKAGDGLAKLDDGTLLEADTVTLGAEASGSGELDINGGEAVADVLQAKIHGLLTVGASGKGTLVCESPANPVQSNGLALGTLGGEGTATLDGGVYHFCPDIEVGIAGKGHLIGKNHAAVDAAQMEIAAVSGGTGTVSLDEASGITLSGALTVGKAGHGRMDLAGGSGISAGSVVVGGDPGALGELVIQDDISGLDTAGDLLVGSQGDGLLAVLNSTAGFVNCKSMTLGGSLPDAGGTFNMDSGAAFTCAHSMLVGSSSGPGLLRVKAQGSFKVGEFLILGARAVVLVERGAVLDAGLQINQGVLRVQNSVVIPASKSRAKAAAGPVRITRGLALGTGARLQVEASDGNALLVEGNATLGGQLEVLLTPGAAYTAGQELDLITFAGAVSGQFAAIEFPNASVGFAASTAVIGDKLRLSVTQGGTGLEFPDPAAEGEGEGEGGGEGEGEPPLGCCNASKAVHEGGAAGLLRYLGDFAIYLLGLGVLLCPWARWRS